MREVTEISSVECMKIDEIAKLKLILFAGKGGVGKTVCSASTGLQLSKLGRKTLVYSVDPAHSLSDCFGKTIGNKTTRITDNLYALEIDAKHFLNQLRKNYLEEINQSFRLFLGRIDLPFEREFLRDVIDLSPPGLDELMALLKLNDFLKAREYDSVIIDMAPGAHAIRLIELPELTQNWASKLLKLLSEYEHIMPLERAYSFIRDLEIDIRLLISNLIDQKQTMLIPVTSAESMAIRVTQDIVNASRSIGIPLRYLVVNQLIIDNQECRFCASSRREQITHVKEILARFAELQIVQTPMFLEPITGLKSLAMFAETIFEGKSELSPLPRSQRVSKIPETRRLKLNENMRIILYGGKGGCGKTTCSAATGLYMAEKGRKTLVFSTDPQNSLSDIFEQDISERITSVKNVNNLYVLQIDAKKLLEQFKQKYREEILEILGDATYLDKRDIVELLDLSLPGMDEVMALMTLNEIVQQNMFDLIILDTAPTGHTFRFLELPDLMSSWATVFLKVRSKTQYIAKVLSGWHVKGKPDVFLEKILQNARKIRTLLQSSDTAFVAVTIAEKMAVTETQRLVSFLNSYGITVENVVVNKIVLPNLACSYCMSREKAELAEFNNIREKFRDKNIVQMRLFPYEITGIIKLKEFGRELLI